MQNYFRSLILSKQSIASFAGFNLSSFVKNGWNVLAKSGIVFLCFHPIIFYAIFIIRDETNSSHEASPLHH